MNLYLAEIRWNTWSDEEEYSEFRLVQAESEEAAKEKVQPLFLHAVIWIHQTIT